MFIKLVTILSLIFYYSFANYSSKDYKLMLVQMLFRHGDRAPVRLYPTDPNPPSVWKNGLGELTQLGKKQHYQLGKFLRHMYRNFSSGSEKEIKVISSSYDRCIQSAMSNLASFFPPDENNKIDENLNWQPIPVHYIPQMIDKYMDADSFCPRAATEEKSIKYSPEAQKFIAKHKNMFINLSHHSGMPINDWTDAFFLYNCLWIEKRFNLTVPAWVKPFWKELEEVSNVAFHWMYKTRLIQRLRAGPLLKRIIDLFLKKISGDLHEQKFQMYSSHDANIAVILKAYDLFPMKVIPYAAALIFELYSGPNSLDYVRLLYLNSTEPEMGFQTPNVLKFPGCEEYCSLPYFVNITEKFIPLYWESECLAAVN